MAIGVAIGMAIREHLGQSTYASRRPRRLYALRSRLHARLRLSREGCERPAVNTDRSIDYSPTRVGDAHGWESNIAAAVGSVESQVIAGRGLGSRLSHGSRTVQRIQTPSLLVSAQVVLGALL